jgi:signal transduction histidine kinase
VPNTPRRGWPGRARTRSLRNVGTTVRALILDSLIAAGSLAYGQAEVWNAASAENLVGPQWVVSVSVGVASMLLLMRRQRPVAVLVTQCVVLTIPALIFGSSEMVGVILPLLIGVYSIGAFAPARSQRVIGGAAVAAALIAHELTDPLLDSWQQVLGASAFWILFPLAWLLGDYARTRRLYVTALKDQAERAQRDREQQTQLTIAQERARIARELHDVVAHGLTVIVRQAEAGEVRMATDPDGARATFDTITVAARQSLAEMRNLVTLLRVDEPTADNPSRQPQLGSFKELLDGVRRVGVHVTAHHDDLSDLPIGVRLTVYRIVQEALTNTLQHAGATQVDVQVRRRPDSLFTQVVDNGTSARAPSRAGHGLIGLRERVAVYGGKFTARAGPTSGFSVTADIPLISGHSE